MATERELRLKLTAENAQLRRALAQSQSDLEAFKTANAGVAPGAEAAAAALSGEGMAAERAAVAADAHVVAYQAVQAANLRVVTGLQEVRAAFAANSAAIVAGGEGQVAALTAVVGAIGRVIVETQALKAIGGVVSPAQQAAIDGYIIKLRELGVAGGLATGELAKVGATSASTAAQTRLLATATAAAGQAMVGKTASLGGLAAALLRFVSGPVGIFITAITLIPGLIRLVVDQTKEWSTKIGETVAGLNEQDGVLRKAGQSTEDYSTMVRLVRDEQELTVRALKAASAGTIKHAGDLETLKAAYLAHIAAVRGVVFETDAYAERLKKLGITVTESVTFEEAEQRIQVFFDEYNTRLKQGENGALRFAEAQKGSIQLWMEAFEDAGKSIPWSLRTIAEQLGITTTRQKELEEAAKKMKAAHEQAAAGAKTQADALSTLPPAVQAAVQSMRGFLGFSLNAPSAVDAQKASLEALIAALQSLGREYDRVKEKGEAAFQGGLPSTTGPLGQGGYQPGGIGSWSPLNPTSTPL